MLELEVSVGAQFLSHIQNLGVVVGLEDEVIVDPLQITGIGQGEAVEMATRHHYAGMPAAEGVVVASLSGHAVGIFIPVNALEHIVIEFENNAVQPVRVHVVDTYFGNVTVNLIPLLVLRVKTGRHLPGKTAFAVCVANLCMLGSDGITGSVAVKEPVLVVVIRSKEVAE